MHKDWKTYKLEDVSDRVTVGFVGSMAQEYIDSGVPMLRSQNIKPFSLDFNNIKYISYEFHKKIAKSALKGGDVAIVRTGAPGTACVIPNGLAPLNCSDLVIVSPNLKHVNPYFLCFYFNSIASHYVNSQLVGAVQQHFNVGAAKKMEINLPSLVEQNLIVDILKGIGDKIELNLQMNKTLEEMAMTLYKHWFVDFGPFQDGNFVESELGLIPEGWEVKKLYSLSSSISKGTTPTKSAVDGKDVSIKFIKVKDIDDLGSIDTDTLELIPESIHLSTLKRSILKSNDILFSIAGTIGRVAILPESLSNSNCNQAVAFIRLDDVQNFLGYIYLWLRSSEIQYKILASVVQGVQANVSLTVLRELELLIPQKVTLDKFNRQIAEYIKLIQLNRAENQHLKATRDLILPKLISGAVRVKENKKTVAEVL